MTQDEIIEMASQSSAFGYVYDAGDTPHLWQFDYKQLISFANLVAAKEREACAKVCDEFNFGQTPMMIQRAIRARGEQVATNDTPKERVDEIQKQRHEANVQKFLGAPQPKQEPVAWVCMKGEKHDIDFDQPEIDAIPVGTFLYTTPPQRTWVGLTDEDWDEIFGNALTIGEAIKATEAKLKQKNGYAEEKNT